MAHRELLPNQTRQSLLLPRTLCGEQCAAGLVCFAALLANGTLLLPEAECGSTCELPSKLPESCMFVLMLL